MERKKLYLEELLQSKAGIELLGKNLNKIIVDKDFYKFGLLIKILEALIENGQSKVVLNNCTLILDNALRDETLDIVTIISKIPEGKKVLLDNKDIIYSKIEEEEVLDFINLLDQTEKNRIFKRNEFVYNLFKKGLIRDIVLGNIIKADLSSFVEEIIKEVSGGKELKKLGFGTYSDAIETNGYVIKLGKTRDRFEMPYHPNILQPIIREKITDNAGNDVLIVEVQDKVDTKNVTKKQRLNLIEKLAKSHIKCRDILEDNIGILLKDNKRRLFNGVGGIIDYEDIQEQTLKPGELVIFDTDMIERE